MYDYDKNAILLTWTSRDINLILLKTGVTQGNLLSMVVYALVTFPFIRKLNTEYNIYRQTWFADDYALVLLAMIW